MSKILAANLNDIKGKKSEFLALKPIKRGFLLNSS